ncbi:hypothetical protein FB45DRAFT_1024546 [Roridomyces roridus]|uniref:Uncharacterized protein n=1 Tax=Roridomyces roridus TaxID=1738132 RepID=A0AAD7C0U6_9AGAR|nr:hypothetical protein FB45DRAFT_1024546 [Roridomyces roridus]
MSFFSFSPELEHTVWVKPHERSLFPPPAPATDSIDTEIALTCTVPGPLVESRLVKAFDDSLTGYPHASGRPRSKGDSWAIGHGARGVPLTFVTTDEPFNHYEYHDLPPPHAVDSYAGENSAAQWDAPLLRVRVTFCRTTNETTIGWSSSRMIGKVEFVYAFMSSWSQHYQHRQPPVAAFDRTLPFSSGPQTFELPAVTLAAQPGLALDEGLHNAILEALAPTQDLTLVPANSTPSGRRSKINLASKCHFGYGAERTRVVLYGDEAEVGYERYFTAPPVKLRDGSWDTNVPASMEEEEEQAAVQSFPSTAKSPRRENEVRAWGRESSERAKL